MAKRNDNIKTGIKVSLVISGLETCIGFVLKYMGYDTWIILIKEGPGKDKAIVLKDTEFEQKPTEELEETCWTRLDEKVIKEKVAMFQGEIEGKKIQEITKKELLEEATKLKNIQPSSNQTALPIST